MIYRFVVVFWKLKPKNVWIKIWCESFIELTFLPQKKKKEKKTESVFVHAIFYFKENPFATFSHQQKLFSIRCLIMSVSYSNEIFSNSVVWNCIESNAVYCNILTMNQTDNQHIIYLWCPLALYYRRLSFMNFT